MARRGSGGALLALLVTAAVAAAGDDAAALRAENGRLREQVTRMEKELAALRMWLGGASLGPDAGFSVRERRALLTIDEFARRGNKLTVEAVSSCEEFRKLLDELALGPARKAQLRLRLDALDDAARRFAALSVPTQDTVRSCQVLAVDRELRTAVISAGSGSGVMPGMVFHAESVPELRLRVIAVQYEGALVEPVSGALDRLVPGMRLSALTVKK